MAHGVYNTTRAHQ